jgi:prevent-host-death family protein
MVMNRTKLTDKDPVVEETVDLPNLVDQVAEGHARIVVTRDGEPKAALVSMEDYARLWQGFPAAKPQEKLSWDEWFAKTQEFQEGMLARRGGQPLDPEIVDRAWREAREELKVEKANEKPDWEEWSREVRKLREDIRESRGGEPIDLDKLIWDMKDDIEHRDA